MLHRYNFLAIGHTTTFNSSESLITVLPNLEWILCTGTKLAGPACWYFDFQIWTGLPMLSKFFISNVPLYTCKIESTKDGSHLQ